MKWYYYLHANGDLIRKNPAVVDPDPTGYFFESPFVVKYWLIDTEDRQSCWIMILEALARAARLNRIIELCEKWHMDFEDSVEFLKRHGTPSKLQRDGMTVFIEKIFKMRPDDFWEKVKAQKEKVSDI